MRYVARSIALTALVGLSVVAASQASWAKTVIVKEGTKVPLVLREKLSTSTARKGQKVDLLTYQPLVVGGRTVVPKGTPVVGTVTKVIQPSGFGKNARIYLALNNLKGPGGVRLPLDTLKTPRKFKGDTAGAASGAGVLVLGPVGAVGGILVKGKEMVFTPGRPFEAAIAADTPVNL